MRVPCPGSKVYINLTQGESDGLAQETAQQYSDNFKAFLATTRSDLAQYNPRYRGHGRHD